MTDGFTTYGVLFLFPFIFCMMIILSPELKHEKQKPGPKKHGNCTNMRMGFIPENLCSFAHARRLRQKTGFPIRPPQGRASAHIALTEKKNGPRNEPIMEHADRIWNATCTISNDLSPNAMLLESARIATGKFWAVMIS